MFGTDLSTFGRKENGNMILPLKIPDLIEHGIYVFERK
jgi:hypothetical protein